MLTTIKNGLFFGLTILLVYTLAYFVSPQLFSKSAFTIPFFSIVGLIFAFLTIYQVNKKNEHKLGFGEGFLYSLLSYSIGITLLIVMMFIHYKLDTDYALLLDNSAREATVAMMSKFGSDSAEVNEILTQVDGLDYKTTFFTVLIRIILNIIWGLFLALGGGIIATILKNK